MSPSANRAGVERGRGLRYFLRHEIYNNSVNSVEAGMDMNSHIVCIEQMNNAHFRCHQ